MSSNKGRFFRQLQETRRVQPDFHVTLIHRASSKTHPELWQRYTDMHAQSGGDPWSGGSKMGQCKVLLERVSEITLYVYLSGSDVLIDCVGQSHYGYCYETC